MYPNPVDDKFFVTLPAISRTVIIKIINMNGAIISRNSYQAVKNVVEVSASSLNRGMYILQVETNNASQTFKFIKK